MLPLPTAFLLLAVAPSAAPPVAAPPLSNPGFEVGGAGQKPPGWALRDVSAAQGFTALLSDEKPARGRLCLEVARKDGFTFGQYASASQTVPAEGLRGKRVRFSALVRTSGLINFSAAG